MTPPPHSGDHCPECFILFEGIDDRIEDLNAKWDDVYNTLTGDDPLHPNGLRDKVDRTADGLTELKTQAKILGAAMGMLLPFAAAWLTRWIA